ncbi:hypothetical protein ACTVZO_39310 [Streptomyces sp. IBSNAI002]|uniref:hypothetical protein n=1 Tax=Streptomyces sp. IBSNAI002 TaxID=3457500 RepID=UPI003FD27FEB
MVSYLTYRFERGADHGERQRPASFLSSLNSGDTDPTAALHMRRTVPFAKRFAGALVRRRRLLLRPGLVADQLAAGAGRACP